MLKFLSIGAFAVGLLIGAPADKVTVEVAPAVFTAAPSSYIEPPEVVHTVPPNKTKSDTHTVRIAVPPILVRIAECESGSRQFDEHGRVVRGEVNPKDVGLFQINEHYWLEPAQELGHDIYTEEGNTAMALHIYELEGTQPWAASKACWA